MDHTGEELPRVRIVATFTKGGVEIEPEPPWTWAEFMRAVEARNPDGRKWALAIRWDGDVSLMVKGICIKLVEPTFEQ